MWNPLKPPITYSKQPTKNKKKKKKKWEETEKKCPRTHENQEPL